MSYKTITISTNGEEFIDITNTIGNELLSYLKEGSSTKKSGILHIFLPHTSCALTISESYDPSARKDMEKFLQHIAPRDLKFLTHTTEGPDDSPSHIKSIVIGPSLQIIVENNEIVLGRWQGIYLCEFRDAPHERNVLMKFIADQN